MNASLDFYAPIFSIRIGGIPIPQLKAATTSIEVDENLESPSMFSFSISEGRDAASQSFDWLDSELLEPENGQDVQIYMGYVSKSKGLGEPLITGRVVALNPSFPSGGHPMLSVQGYDRSFCLKKSVTKSGRVFDKEKDYRDIVRKIARDHNLEEGEIDSSITPCEKVTQEPGKSDYDFLENIAGRIGYEFFVRNKSIHFRAPREFTEEAFTLKWGRELISFNPRLSTAKVINKITVKGHNKKDPSKPIIGIASLEDMGFRELEAKIKAAFVRTCADKEMEASEYNFPVCNQEDANILARALLAKANNSFIEGSCESIGNPELRPGMNIRIEGVGRRFSGRYYIKSVKHSIGEGGYISSFEVRRGLAGAY